MAFPALKYSACRSFPLLTVSTFGVSKRSFLGAHRFYSTQKPPRNRQSPTKQPLVLDDRPSRPDEKTSLHEPEESIAGSTPGFNPPGGAGPNIGPGGSGSWFSITRSPLLDAALTTIIGLGMGDYH